MIRVAEQTAREQATVSVAMITYNHEQFIAQAIESVLMQETAFVVELVIGEDCSTDGTRRIVQAYAAKYPNVIRALLPEKNLGMARNYQAVWQACGGKYIAWLEGDDYWRTPQKLQKQVALMEANPHYSMCGTKTQFVTTSSDGAEEDAANEIFRDAAQELSALFTRQHAEARPAFRGELHRLVDFIFGSRIKSRVQNFSCRGV